MLQDAQLNEASNNIAISLAKAIIHNNGLLPSIEGIGAFDAGSVASGIFNQLGDPSVYSPWAGTIFFPFVSEFKFYNDWLLNLNTVSGAITDPDTSGLKTVQFKTIDGTYDLIEALQAFQTTTIQDPISSAIAAFKGTTNPSILADRTQAFVLDSYGLTSSQIPFIGTGTPFDSRFILLSPSYIALTVKDDTKDLFGIDYVVNAGPGNDRLIVHQGTGLIDGGDGVNTADFTQWAPLGKLHFNLESVSNSFFNYRYEVPSSVGANSLFLYEMQNVIGDSSGDTLNLSTFGQSFWNNLGQNLNVDLGRSNNNEIDIDGSATIGTNSFFVTQGSSGKDLLVSGIANDAGNTPGTYGADVTDVGNIVITAGNADSSLIISGNLSQSLGTTHDIRFIGGSGTATIDASAMTSGSTIEVQAGTGTEIIRMGGNETLKLDNIASFTGTIYNFSSGNTIDLPDVAAFSPTVNAGNVLTLQTKTNDVVTVILDPTLHYSADDFTATGDGHGGTNVTMKTKLGYYITIPGDTAASITNTLNNKLPSSKITSDMLMRVNAVFGVDLTVPTIPPGTLMHVPVSAFNLVFEGFSRPTPGTTLVYDPASTTICAVGASLDGHDDGALIVDTPVFAGYTVFDKGSYSTINPQPNGTVQIGLIGTDGITLGTLLLNPATGAGTVTLPNGGQVNVPAGAHHLTNIGGTAEATLLGYLGELGVSTNGAQLSQLNDALLNPATAVPTLAQGTVFRLDDTHAEQLFSDPRQNGAVFTGIDTATITTSLNQKAVVPVTNIAQVSGDITQDVFSNIQLINLVGNTTLTAAQFAGFTKITGGGTITVVNDGSSNINTVNLNGVNVGSNLVAGSWLGTTLIGNNASGQILTASLFGNDTLIAGNGIGDTLVAGEGIDTLIGGIGGDTFIAANGLAAGSSIQGNGLNNTLRANGDISQASITGIQTLVLDNGLSAPNVTMTAAQFNSFTSIKGKFSFEFGETITAATGGTYDLTGKLPTGSGNAFNMTAGSDEGTTLVSYFTDPVDLIVLTASAHGNDTLISASVPNSSGFGGFHNRLIATGTTGNDTLIAMFDQVDTLDASDSSGNDTLRVGNGIEQTLNVNDSSGDNTITAGDGNQDQLLANGSIGDNRLTAGNGNQDILDVSNSFGDNTLVVGGGAQNSLRADNSFGNNTLTSLDSFTTNSSLFFRTLLTATGSSGDNVLTAGDANFDGVGAGNSFGNNTLTAGNGNQDALGAAGSFGNNRLTAGNGNHDTLNVANSFGDNILTVGSGSGDIMDARGSLGNITFNAGAGSDTMFGGEGNNTYNFANANLTSNYTINNAHSGNGTSVIQLAANVTSGDVTLSQSGNDLVLAFATDPITVQNYFAGVNFQISGIQFADGTVWDQQKIASLVSSANLAQATVNNGAAIDFGNVRMGSAVSQALSITNTGVPIAENLDAFVGQLSGNATASGSFSLLAAGNTDATDITVGMTTDTVGVQTGSVMLNFESDGTGIDSNGISNLSDQTVQLTETVYREASASVASLPSNVIVHVGDVVTEQLAVTNTAANDGFSENLVASVVSAAGSVSASGSTGDIAAQATNNSLAVNISTAAAGVVNGSVTLDLASDGTGVDGLGSVDLGTQTVAVNATVNNYAKAALQELSGGGTFVQNGNNYALTLNMGPAGVASPDVASFNLGVLNNVTGPSDLLSGGFVTSGSSAFTLAGFGSFSGLNAGQADSAPTVSFKATGPGSYVETITLHSTGSNASSYSSALADETLTLTVNVGQTYTLTNKADTITGGAGNNVIIAKNNTLNATDSIDGGAIGTQTLTLQGGGKFDLRAPATLKDIQIITAQEASDDSRQTIYLRDGLNATVNVASAAVTPNSSDDLPGITIIGANNSDIINLGNGNDDVTLGSAAEIVNAGNGNNIFRVTSNTIGATIHAGTGNNLLDITGGGTMVMDSNITDVSSVTLEDATTAYNFTANNTANLAINGSKNSDTITVGAASQTVNAKSGNDRILATSANAGALINGGNGVSTLEITTGGMANMNANDKNLATVQLDAATNLTMNAQSNLTALGSSGSDTIIANGKNQTLTGNGGKDSLIGSTLGSDTFLDTANHLNGSSITNFAAKGSILDITDLKLVTGSTHFSFKEDASNTFGTLTVTDGTHNAAIQLFGQFMAAGFGVASDGKGGSSFTYTAPTAHTTPSPFLVNPA
jgi:hypothetical protein